MLKTASLVALLAACGAQQQAAAAPAPGGTCDRTGGIVFEVATQETKADGRGTFVRLYRGGALEIMHSNGDLPPRSTTRCAGATLATVSKHVAAAPWKLTLVPACGAVAITQTTYFSDGKRLWTDETCAKDKLDADSEQHLAAILAAMPRP